MNAPKPQCRSCEEPVVWALTEAGRWLPFDKDRDEAGASVHVLSRDTRLQLHVRVLKPGDQLRSGIEHRHMLHFDTCAGGAPR